MKDIDKITQLIIKDTEEVLTEEDIKALLSSNTPLKHYIGFEISGLIHLGTGIESLYKLKDFQEAGVECRILLADWHTWINHKLGQDLGLIREVALGYFKESFVEMFKILGINADKVEFILGSDLYHNNDTYWLSAIDVADSLTLARVEQMLEIMGRKQSGDMRFSRLIYPCMQIADHYQMGVNIIHSGTDQRKATVKGKEVANKIRFNQLKDANGNIIKPVGIMHHLLQGLQKPLIWPIPDDINVEMRTALKMSKSIPNSAIFIHESPDVIREKIKIAFCPPNELRFNPIIDWVEHIIFKLTNELLIKRDSKHGGNLICKSANEVKELFAKGALHPEDLKNAIAEILIESLRPVRERTQRDFAVIVKKLEEVNRK